MTDYQTLTVHVDGALARLTFSRPAALNALAPETLDELLRALAELNANSALRVLVLEGQGRAFSVGFDLQSMGARMAGGMPSDAELQEAAAVGGRVIRALRTHRAATIASIHGYAVGGGFLIAAACDFRVAAADTVCSVPEVDIGLPLAWGGVPLLVRELGPGWARELIWLGRKVRAEELSATGFFHACVPSEKRPELTQNLAEELLAKPPVASQAIQEQLLAAIEPALAPEGPSDPERFSAAIRHPDFLPTAMGYMQRLRARKKGD